MKKSLFLMLSLATFTLEAAHFQSSMSVTPILNNEVNEYLVDMQIKKVVDANSAPQLIASPKIICMQGEPAQLTIESEDKADLLSIQITIPENASQTSVHASCLMKEKGEVVLSFDHVIQFNSHSFP